MTYSQQYYKFLFSFFRPCSISHCTVELDYHILFLNMKYLHHTFLNIVTKNPRSPIHHLQHQVVVLFPRISYDNTTVKSIRSQSVSQYSCDIKNEKLQKYSSTQWIITFTVQTGNNSKSIVKPTEILYFLFVKLSFSFQITYLVYIWNEISTLEEFFSIISNNF